MPKWSQNGSQNLMKNKNWNEKDMQQKWCRNWLLQKVAKKAQREGKGSDELKKWGRGDIWATPDGVGGVLPALKGGGLLPGGLAAASPKPLIRLA